MNTRLWSSISFNCKYRACGISNLVNVVIFPPAYSIRWWKNNSTSLVACENDASNSWTYVAWVTTTYYNPTGFKFQFTVDGV
ncbi:MAG: hypothetical protein IPL95_02845 [Saprospiraceae bacterium]|nr:hypothetical protein [Saprospiraceae bacterium]